MMRSLSCSAQPVSCVGLLCILALRLGTAVDVAIRRRAQLVHGTGSLSMRCQTSHSDGLFTVLMWWSKSHRDIVSLPGCL